MQWILADSETFQFLVTDSIAPGIRVQGSPKDHISTMSSMWVRLKANPCRE
jgi:hypothetical protein